MKQCRCATKSSPSYRFDYYWINREINGKAEQPKEINRPAVRTNEQHKKTLHKIKNYSVDKRMKEIENCHKTSMLNAFI